MAVALTLGELDNQEKLISLIGTISVANLDLDLVKTFVAVAERGSFRAAAAQIWRTQSAVSQQIQRLEGQLGETLLVRTSRNVRLSPGGERFLGYARRRLRLSDEAAAAVRGKARRFVRIGASDDIAGYVLMPVLADLRNRHPDMAFEVTTGATRELLPQLDIRYDVVLGLGLPGSKTGTRLCALPLRWVGRATGKGAVPLALYPEGCIMRGQALATLDEAGIPWEIALSASALTVIEASARARLAVAPVAFGLSAPDLPLVRRLPALPTVELRLYNGKADPEFCAELGSAIARLASGATRRSR